MSEVARRRKCAWCKAVKDGLEFGPLRDGPGGRDRYCRVCRRARHRAYREKHREVLKAKVQAWRKANPDKVRDQHRRLRARRKGGGGVAEHFTEAEFQELLWNVYQGRCAGCGVAAQDAEVAGRAIVADHIKPLSCGGDDTIQNIQPLCGLCNGRKGGRDGFVFQEQLFRVEAVCGVRELDVEPF